MIYRYITRIFLMLALVALVGCGAEAVDDTAIDTKNAYAISFDLSVLESKTRAVEQGDKTDVLNENKIETLHMFFYEGNEQRGYFSTEVGNLAVAAGVSVLDGKATAYIPKTGTNPYFNKAYTMYVVVNYPSGAPSLQGKTLPELKCAVYHTSTLSDQQHSMAKQQAFLMDGSVPTGTIRWEAGSNIYQVPTTVNLSRAAAKIRLLIGQIRVEGFEQVGVPMVSMVNGVDKTTLCAGKMAQTIESSLARFTTDYQPMARKTYDNKEFWARAVPFYTYENDWSQDGDIRTYLSVKVRLKKNGSSTEQDFYYSIPINYLHATISMRSDERENITKIQRNHLYDIRCNIAQLGELDPGKPTELRASISLEDWNETSPIDGSIANAHYLVVKELEPEMPNVNVRDIEYFSDLPLDQNLLNAFSASYVGYNYLGEEVPVAGNANTSVFRNIKITTFEREGKKYIRVTNPVPKNYVPWTIKFRAQHEAVPGETGQPLYKDVVVTQYPPIYVTAKRSSGNEIYWYSTFGGYRANGIDANGNARPGFQVNNTLYKVHVLVPREGDIVGDPTLGTDATSRTAEANNIISPEFIIASQWGLTTPVPQSSRSTTPLGWSTLSLGTTLPGIAQDYYAYTRAYLDDVVGYGNNAYRYRDYWDAESRAFRYWEDEYGPSFSNKEVSGNYNGYNNRNYRMYYSKTFKHNGHWRIPTIAELALIVSIQSDPNSAVKSLLWGTAYWSARTNYVYNFTKKKATYETLEFPVRPIFDTYNK